MASSAFIALGGNLDDRQATLDRAVAELRAAAGIRIRQVSRYWETAAVGGPPGQSPYLNAVAEVETDLEPRPLMALLLAIEQKLGRERRERFGPRNIDLDLLLHGESVVNQPGLVVPHPRMHERTFVLGPLAEIAPTARHPTLDKTAVEMLAELARRAPRTLAGFRAVVTGASSGIGKGIALAFARHGADVLVHANRSGEAAEATAAEAERMGVRSRVLLADLRDPAAVQKLASDAWGEFGPLDIWVNNAGADVLTGERFRQPFENKLRELWYVDVAAAILLARDIGQRMKSRGRGAILNIGWDRADTGMEGDGGQMFAAAKSAVAGFTRSLALTLAPEVRVNCIAPGWIRTAWGEHASTHWQDRVLRETPLARWGTPEDVAAAAVWLASPHAAFITAQVIRVNGGAV